MSTLKPCTSKDPTNIFGILILIMNAWSISASDLVDSPRLHPWSKTKNPKVVSIPAQWSHVYHEDLIHSFIHSTKIQSLPCVWFYFSSWGFRGGQKSLFSWSFHSGGEEWYVINRWVCWIMSSGRQPNRVSRMGLHSNSWGQGIWQLHVFVAAPESVWGPADACAQRQQS